MTTTRPAVAGVRPAPPQSAPAPVHPGTFDAVLIDLDGVLIDSRPGVLALWRGITAEHGRHLTADDTRRHVLGCAPEHTVRNLFGDLAAATRRRILAQVQAAEPELGFAELPGAGALVRELHRAGVALALVTGASPDRARRVLRGIGAGQHFGALVAWGDVPNGKPAPDGYLLAASRLGVDPRHCLVLEDAPAGVTAARAAGAACIGIAADGAADLADRGARPVVASVADLRCAHAEDGRIALVADGQTVAVLEG